LSSSMSVEISGIYNYDIDLGRHLLLMNIGNSPIILTHNDVASTDIYRIACPDGADLQLDQNDSCWLFYDKHSAIWRVAAFVSGTVIGGGADAITALTGDVTATGPGSVAATIAADAVTYAKLQNISATDRLLGRDTAGAGNAEELTVSNGIEFTGSGGIQLSATGVAADTYGDADHVSVVTVDAKGRVTSASEVSINANSAAVDPDDISGLYLWLKADAGVFSDAGTTPAVNTDTVQQWNDQSGNNNHATQATAGKRPQYLTGIHNSLPVIRFSSDCLTVSVTLTTFTVIIAFRNTAANAVILEQGATVASNDGFLLFSDSPGSTQVRKSATVSSRNYAVGWGGTGQYVISGLHYGGSHATHYGLNESSPRIGGTATGNEPGSGSTTATLNIGSRNDAASAPIAGDILEILLYTPAISLQDVRGLMAYLQRKWNL
jgi:hypothetical protein